MIRAGDWVRVKASVNVYDRYASRLQHGINYHVNHVYMMPAQNRWVVSLRLRRMGGFAVLTDYMDNFELVCENSFCLDQL